MRILLVAAVLACACAHTPSQQEAPPDELGSSDSDRLLQDEEAGPGGSAASADSPPGPAEAEQAAPPPPRCSALTADGQIRHTAVSKVVDGGLGRWLQGVRVERVLDKNRFQGWKVQVLHLANPCYATVDLRPGDVVTSINGSGPKKLERPESAQAVFNSLKQAKAIEVQYLRDGQPGTLRYTIVPEERR